MITLCWYCTCSAGKPIKNDKKADPISKVQSVSNEAYGVPTDLMNVQENLAYSSMQSHSQPLTTSSHVQISKVQSVSNEAYGVPTDLMNVQENLAYSSMQSHSQPPTTSSHVQISKIQSVSNEAYGVHTDLMNVQENLAYSSMQSHSQPPTTSSHVYDVVDNTGARETVEDHNGTTEEQ